MSSKTYHLTIEFDKYKKSYEGVQNIRVEDDHGVSCLKFTSKHGEEFSFVVNNFVCYYFEED